MRTKVSHLLPTEVPRSRWDYDALEVIGDYYLAEGMLVEKEGEKKYEVMYYLFTSCSQTYLNRINSFYFVRLLLYFYEVWSDVILKQLILFFLNCMVINNYYRRSIISR